MMERKKIINMRVTFRAIQEQTTDWLIECYKTPSKWTDKKVMRLIRKVIHTRTGKWI